MIIYTRAFAAREKKERKKEREGYKETQREEKNTASLKALSQKRARSVTFNYIYLPEMTRPALFIPRLLPSAESDDSEQARHSIIEIDAPSPHRLTPPLIIFYTCYK